MGFLPPLTPNVSASLRDATSPRPESRLSAARGLAAATGELVVRAREALLSLLHDPVGPVRSAAAEGLGTLGDPSALPALREAFEDPDFLVRQAAIVALTEIGGDDARAALEAALDAPHPEVRFQAIRGLGELAPRAAAAAASAALSDEDAEVRCAAAETLGQVGAGEHAEALVSALSDPAPQVRRWAALALAALEDDRGAAELRAALGDPGWAIEAADALGRLGVEAAREELAAVAGRRFCPLAIRAAAGAALARMGDERGVDALRSVLRAFRPDGRSFAVQLVGELELEPLAAEVARLARRRRGVDPDVLRSALERLAPTSEAARRSLEGLEPEAT